MRKVMAFLFGLVASGYAAISSLAIPNETISAGTPPQVVWVDQNFDSVTAKVNQIKDSINLYLVGGGSFLGTAFYSNSNLRLGIDNDANSTGLMWWVSHNATDSLFRVKDDSTWRAFGAGIGTKLTLSDSILAATMRISGLTASRLMATNAGSTAASVADLTAWVAGTANQITSTSDGDGSITLSIPNGFTLPSASPTFTGLTLSGLSSGRIPVVSTSGLITQDNLYWDATNDRLGIGATSPARTLHVTASSGDVAQRINASTGYTAYNEYTENNSTTAGNYWQIGKEATTNRLFFFNGSTRLEITSAGAVTIPGTLGVTGAASTGALTATTITLGGGESFVYGDTSFTLTGSTGWTTTPTGTSQARRIGNIVTLTVPYLSGTSNSTSTTITGIPSGWYPSTYVQYVPLSITVDNGTTGYGGTARILTSGGITVYPNNGTAWTASGSKEVGEGSGHQTITYVLQ